MPSNEESSTGSYWDLVEPVGFTVGVGYEWDPIDRDRRRVTAESGIFANLQIIAADRDLWWDRDCAKIARQRRGA